MDGGAGAALCIYYADERAVGFSGGAVAGAVCHHHRVLCGAV